MKRNFLLALLVTSTAVAEDGCFTRDDIHKLNYKVIQRTTPVRQTSGEYPYRSPFYPVSTFTTPKAELLNPATLPSPSGFKFGKTTTIWGNRCIFLKGISPAGSCANKTNSKGNYLAKVPGETFAQKPIFSTLVKADNCTFIQTRIAAGFNEAWTRDYAQRNGLVFWKNPARVGIDKYLKTVTLENGTRLSNQLVDVCIVSELPMNPDSEGVTLDWEVLDQRTPAQTLSLFNRLKNLLANKNMKLSAFTNDVCGAESCVKYAASYKNRNGIDSSNIAGVLSALDWLAPVVYSGEVKGDEEFTPQPRKFTYQKNYNDQIAFLSKARALTAAQKKKIYPMISLYGLRKSDAQDMNKLLRSGVPGGMVMWRANASQTGDCGTPENKAMSCVYFNSCNY